MKCIKCIKQTKFSTIGDIRRVNDKEAEEKVITGYWNYVAKMEWKTATRKPTVVEEAKEVVNSQSTETIAKKQLKRKKNSK